MTITFVTTNNKKFETVSGVLREYGITLEQDTRGYHEYQSETFEEICKRASKELAELLQKPVLVDDSGIFFNAYNNFPGPLTRPLFDGIGLEGILRMLTGVDRTAYYQAVLGYCEPHGGPVCFTSRENGTITTEIRASKDAIANTRMPYDYIFIPEGFDKVVFELPQDAIRVSHRAHATHELGKYLQAKQ